MRETVRSGFWAVPAACVAVALLLAVGLVAFDRARDSTDTWVAFGAGPDGAREVLSAITTSMITFTGLVFSITIVVLQLTSSQFSPRVLRTFLRDVQTQLSLGVFVATFVYAMMVLRTVNAEDEATFVPAFATAVGVLLLLVSVGVFVSYIHHVATTIQVSSIIASIGAETRKTIDARFPTGEEANSEPVILSPIPAVRALHAKRSGVVTNIDEDALVRLARHADVVLTTAVRSGDYVPEGAPLVGVSTEGSELDADAALGAVHQKRERSMQQDVAFGFRQLVDIAERALSPGVNDPTTAVQALDELHDLLRRLSVRPLRSGIHRDEEGTVRFVAPPDRLEDFLALALDEIEQYGAESIQVRQRVRELLEDVHAAARPEHRAAVGVRLSARS